MNNNGTVGKLILDTHVLIWYIEGIKLDKNQVNIIDTSKSNNQLFISAIYIWEISMLASKGKIAFSIGISE